MRFSRAEGDEGLNAVAFGIDSLCGGRRADPVHLEWHDPHLFFVVREPFISRHSQAQIVAGMIAPGDKLMLKSLMPSGGVIFSDGIESDYMQFDSGSNATIAAAAQKAHLIVQDTP